MTQFFSKYFLEVLTTDEYQVYKNNDSSSPLVLFSEIDGTSLASLHFKKSSRKGSKNDSGAQTIIANYSEQTCQQKSDGNTNDVQRFQGIISKDNQEFELVISNLSTKGQICFDLTKSDNTSDRINQVDCLFPKESYLVQCDRINNFPMILQRYKNQSGNVVTVENDENERIQTKGSSDESSKGSYIYLNVTPEEGDLDLIERFKKTFWKVSDYIVIKKEKLPLQNKEFNDIKSSDYEGYLFDTARKNKMTFKSNSVTPGFYINYKGFTEPGYHDIYRVLPENCNDLRNFNNPKISCGSYMNQKGEIIGQVNKYNKPITKRQYTPINWDDVNWNDVPEPTKRNIYDTYDRNKVSGEKNQYRTINWDDVPDPTKRETCERDTYAGYISINWNDVPDPTKRDSEVTCEKNKYKAKLDLDVIRQSDVGNIVYGDTKIKVKSYASKIKVDPTKKAKLCVIGLSINENLEFTLMDNSQNDDIKEAELIINSVVNKQFEEFLKDKIFVSNECVICLNDSNDCVFYSCAHKCCHYSCAKTLQKCPVCRSNINAKIKISME